MTKHLYFRKSMSKTSRESRESIDLDLSRYLLMVKRQWIPSASIFIAIVTLSALATTWFKPSYEAEGKLLFKLPSFQVLGSNLLSSGSQGETGDLKPLVSSQNPINTEIEIIYSPSVLQQTLDKLKLRNPKDEPLKIEDLKKSLTVKIIGGTDVVKIAYKSPKPEEAASVVNTVMKLYLENDIITTRTEAETTYKFLARQLLKVQDAVQVTEVGLRKFKQENNVVDLTEETRSVVGIIGNLENEINTVQAQLEDLNAQTDTLRQKIALNSQQATAISSLNNSPAIQGILTQIQEVDRQLATESSRFFDDSPIMISLEAKKSKLKTLLQTQTKEITGSPTQVPPGLLQIGQLRQTLIQNLLQAEIQSSGLSKRLASLSDSRSAYQRRVKIIPMLVQNQRNLERKVEVAQSTYETILKKVQELQVARNKNTANARIINLAEVPQKPAISKKLIVLVLGVMLGALFATTTILLIEMRDRSLKTLEEVRKVFGYTLLGILPMVGKKLRGHHQDLESNSPEIVVRDMPDSLSSEMYRMINANLKFLSSDKKLKVIVITSAVSKEGKSTVSANLAVAIAQLGRQVLLIDADMRLPSQHHLWGLTNAAGLSEILVGQTQFDAATNKVIDNLDVLTAGVRPPNPLALLDSKRMASLIGDFADRYDFVIIDAPPLLLAADALTLSQMTDGIVLVARPGVIDYNSAIAAKEMLERPNQNILGMVVNGLIEKNEPSSYFSHTKEYFTQAATESEFKQLKTSHTKH